MQKNHPVIVCGFAFDPHVSEESKRYGKLMVLPTRINPDLAMGDLLKKTGAGNLFMVFGEPDLIVASEEWLVDSSGKRIAPYEIFKFVSGLDSLAKINRLDVRIYEITRNYPSEERFGIISQMRRAASSISANIAEGQARRTTGEFLQSLGMARGSLAELETFLILSE